MVSIRARGNISSLDVSRNALFQPTILTLSLPAKASRAVATPLFAFRAASFLALSLLVVFIGNGAGAAEPPHQVVIVHDAEATEAFRPDWRRIRSMADNGLTHLTGKATVAEAWRSLLKTNSAVVGIKVYSAPGPNSGTRPAVVAAFIEQLLAAGVASTNIVLWDRDLTDLRLAGFSDLAEKYRVRLAGSLQIGFDEQVFYDRPLLGNLVWGDLEFGRKADRIGRKSFVTKLLTRQITHLINISPLLNHNVAGVSGNLYSLAMGSVDNFARFEGDPVRLARAVPEIYAMAEIGDRVVLNVTDALICQYEGGERGLLHYSAVLNELRLSRDPVALDLLSIQELETQRHLASAPVLKPNLDLYNTAALLELGVTDTNRMLITRLPGVQRAQR
jgi:Domain of unknown function (DUF362)